jgi:predicted dinucleotide-binding enzyme
MTSITIIGAGNIGSAVATIAIKSGASVQVIDRDATKAQSIEGATATVFAEPITGDIVVLALPYGAYDDVLSTYADQLADKTVVDPSNPDDFSTFLVSLPEGVESAASDLAAKLPNSKIVKAFNTTFAATLATGVNDGEPTTVLVSSDDADAKKAVSDFITKGGLRAADAGTLAHAPQMEALGALQMFLAANGQTQWTTGFKVLK